MKCGTRDQISGRSDDRLPAHRTQITSDAGLLTHRGLDAAVGLTDLADAALSEFHWGKNTRHSLAGVLCQSVFGRLAGHENVNDDDRLAHAVLLGSRPR